MKPETTNTYHKPIVPSSPWELMQWFFFEPNRIYKYEEGLKEKEKIKVFLSVYWRWCLIIILLWLLGNALIALLPTLEADIWREKLVDKWENLGTWGDRFLFLLEYNFFGLALGLVAGTMPGVAAGMAFSMAFSMAVGLAGGLAVGLVGGLAVGLAGGLVVSLGGGLVVGREGDLRESLAVSLVVGLTYGLTEGSEVGLERGLEGGLAAGLAFYFSHHRLHILFGYLFRDALTKVSFPKNIYLKDALVWWPLYFHNKQLINLAKEQPKEAEPFIDFLLEHRPLQRKLAMHLQHSAQSGRWYNTSLRLRDFEPSNNTLNLPLIAKDQPKFQPSLRWADQLQQLKATLIQAQQATNAVLRQDKYAEVVKALEAFTAIHYSENPLWTKHYTEVFPKWKKQAEAQLADLKQAAEGIILNPYQAGDPLQPTQHKETFLGRGDLREEIEFEIRQAARLPMFLLQGQRRVGKTSILNFLDELLGKGYKVLHQDFQSATDLQDVPTWLEAIRRKTNALFAVQENTAWQASDNWLQSWRELSDHLLALSQQQQTKIVLAFDEYEELHEHGFKGQAYKAGRLLGAMRSFSQRQQEVIFLFAGAKHFFELENPHWGDYFVQAKHLLVDYLGEADSRQLLTAPYPDFPLRYAPGLLAQIHHLTQGHPYLLQQIGREMVNLANQKSLRLITTAHFDHILNDKVLVEGNGGIAVFWGQFCRQQEMKETVLAIIQQQQIHHPQHLRRLARHHYIVVSPSQPPRLRVPIFELWVKKFCMDFKGY